jgi:hypothetical protein
MRLVKVFILLIIPTICFAADHQEYFDTHLRNLTAKLNSCEYPGPLSEQVARVALARQSLEDGLERKSDVSIAGISTGGFNKEIVDKTIENSGLSVGYAFDSDGGRFYVFKGCEANIYSALCISRLFNIYVDRFLDRDKKSWFQAKQISRAILQSPDSFELNHLFYMKLAPDKIIERANRLFGPKYNSVIRISNGYKTDTERLN